MPKDDRKLLSVLKAELAFLEQGGYRNLPSSPWRSPLVFQDSPTGLNFDRTQASSVLSRMRDGVAGSFGLSR